jgi:predicted MFS family arabinose efflux permease
MESLASPLLAAALLSVMSFHWLFSGTAIGFLASALLVATTVLPQPKAAIEQPAGIYARTTKGIRIYLKTPRLRGVLAVTLAAAAASAMVIVNTVVIVREILGLAQSDVAIALAAYGAGSILAALSLPRLLDRVGDRSVMLGAALVLSLALGTMAAVAKTVPAESLWSLVLAGWFILGVAYSMSVTPTGRLLRRSANPEDRPALFAAQFSLSHACWLIAYPMAGWLGSARGQAAAFAAMAMLAVAGALCAAALWPRRDPEILPHRHDDLPPDHPHLLQGHGLNAPTHTFVIDHLHPQWPKGV